MQNSFNFHRTELCTKTQLNGSIFSSIIIVSAVKITNYLWKLRSEITFTYLYSFIVKTRQRQWHHIPVYKKKIVYGVHT